MANKKLASEKVTYEIDPYNRLIINKSGLVKRFNINETTIYDAFKDLEDMDK